MQYQLTESCLTTNTVNLPCTSKNYCRGVLYILFFVSFHYSKPTTTFGDVVVYGIQRRQYNRCLYGQTVRGYGSPEQKPSFVWSNFSIVDKVFFLVFSSLTDAIAADIDNPLELVEDASCEVLKAVCSNVTSTQKMTVFAR
ncbi:hypothetical protein T11_12616 [Trichinella zimbabwensis]|uniref:Uncharacterized protein n=1 Tax=Trichinella zimbabwensis TaxID=268475 RepID=A0A0V1I877_9BILA|nr:hypothetical protein T11_12616 [Trichinella zimbabwensis]